MGKQKKKVAGGSGNGSGGALGGARGGVEGMDLPEIVKMMVANDLTEVSYGDAEVSLTIKRGGAGMVMTAPTMYAAPHAAPAAPVASPAATPAGASALATPAAAAKPAAPASTASAHVESPMVGTFYSRPNPDAKPFVTVGQSVTKDTVVCIIEAMKVFNEIKAEKDGVVDSVLVKDGQAVEFGQKLFGLR